MRQCRAKARPKKAMDKIKVLAFDTGGTILD
jgi:hypothetical protein